MILVYVALIFYYLGGIVAHYYGKLGSLGRVQGPRDYTGYTPNEE